MKDFRPVALTSILCKCMERVLSNHLTAMVADRLDPLQFAYKAKRGVDDACLTLLDTVCRHLDSSQPHTHRFYLWTFLLLLTRLTHTFYVIASWN